MTRFKYYSNYLARLLGTLIAFELCWIGAGWIYLENPDYCTIQGVAAKPAEPDPADVLAQEIAGKVKSSGLDPADVLNRVEKILGVA